MERRRPLLELVRGTITKYGMLPLKAKVVIGVSGGPDSVSLTHLLRRLREEYHLTLWIAHLNHLLRGKDGDKEQEWVRRFGQQLGIGVISDSTDVAGLARKQKLSLEEAGRLARYDFLARVADRAGATRIALGHTASDQVETFLMRMIQGSGLGGLAGIPPVRDRFIRPLIETFRDRIEIYCREMSLHPCQDSSNLDECFLRNRIRLNLIPDLSEEYNPKIQEAVLRVTQILRQEEDYLEMGTEKTLRPIIVGQSKGELILDVQKLDCLHPAMQRRVIRKVLGRVKGSLKGVTFTHISSILGMDGEKGTKKLDLPDGLTVQREYKRLRIGRKKSKKPFFEYSLVVPGRTELAVPDLALETRIVPRRSANFPRGKGAVYLDWDKLEEPIVVRQRKIGDRFQPAGMKGTKKIKDFFIDLKIPLEKRDTIPLVVSKGRIAWVVGFRVDERFKTKNDTQRVLEIRMVGNEC